LISIYNQGVAYMLRVLDNNEITYVSGGMDEEPQEMGGGDGAWDGGGADAQVSVDFGNDLQDTLVTADGYQSSDNDIVVQATWGQVIDAWLSVDNVDLNTLADQFDRVSDGFGTAADVGEITTTALGLGAGAQLGLDIPNDIATAASGTATAGSLAGKVIFHGLAQAARQAAY